MRLKTPDKGGFGFHRAERPSPHLGDRRARRARACHGWTRGLGLRARIGAPRRKLPGRRRGHASRARVCSTWRRRSSCFEARGGRVSWWFAASCEERTELELASLSRRSTIQAPGLPRFLVSPPARRPSQARTRLSWRAAPLRRHRVRPQRRWVERFLFSRVETARADQSTRTACSEAGRAEARRVLRAALLQAPPARIPCPSRCVLGSPRGRRRDRPGERDRSGAGSDRRGWPGDAHAAPALHGPGREVAERSDVPLDLVPVRASLRDWPASASDMEVWQLLVDTNDDASEAARNGEVHEPRASFSRALRSSDG